MHVQVLEVFPTSQTSGCLSLECPDWKAEVFDSLNSELKVW